MAIDFKTPNKFVFDHKKGKVTDKLRKLLGLVYETPGDPLDPFIDFTQIPDQNEAIGKLGSQFVITRSNKQLGNEAIESFIVKRLEEVQVGNQIGYSELFEDFNFKIDDTQVQNFSVQTIVRDLQESDIQENNLDYPGGTLSSDKNETSLKFAYAFETIRIQGEEQIVFRKVQLTNESKELIKQADNENLNSKEIATLKNLFYKTEEGAEIEKELIDEGSQADFGIDKIYNIITIDLNPDKEKNSLYKFKELINGLFTNYVTDLELYNSIDKISFLNNARGTGFFLKPEFEKLDDFEFTTTGYNLTEALALRTELLGSLLSLENFINPSSAFSVLPNTLIKKNEIEKIWSLSSFISTDNNFKQELEKTISDFIVYDSILSSPFSYDLVDVSTKFSVGFKSPLVNWTQADLFRSANKKGGQFVFSYGDRQANLLRDGKMVGLKLVKSTSPYDPANPTANIGQIQAFYLPLNSSKESRQIRLFDSQIIYGKTYYYTLFGIYYVDGKFYFYPETTLNKVKIKTGEQTVTIEENKEEISSGNKAYKNPCCEYNYFTPTAFFNNFVEPVNLSEGNVIAFKNDAAGGQVLYDSLPADQKYALDRLAEIGLAWGKYTDAGSFVNPSELQKSYEKLEPEIQKSFACFICREGQSIKRLRDNAGKKGTNISYGAEDNISGEKPLFLKESYALIGRRPQIAALIDCTEFGWNTAYGDAANSPVLLDYSLEYFGKNKESTEIYEDGNNITLSGPGIPRCKIKNITNVLTEKLKEFKFQLFESNARRTYQIPLLPSLENSVVSLIPLPPVVEFVPLADVNDRIKIKFQESVGSDYTKVKVDAAVKTLNGQETYLKIENRSINVAKENGITLITEELLARSEGDIKEIYSFKLDRVPDSLQDLIDSGERFILDYKNGKTAYFSNILPNQKYYYCFVSRDVTGLYSIATETFQVEIIEDSGFVYAKISVYDYITKEEKVISKDFQKLLKIKPSFEEMLPQQSVSLGSTDLYSRIKFADGGSAGSDDQPPKFKIRIRSKKTNRVFDINLKYSQTIKEITSKKLIEQLKKISELVDEKKN